MDDLEGRLLLMRWPELWPEFASANSSENQGRVMVSESDFERGFVVGWTAAMKQNPAPAPVQIPITWHCAMCGQPPSTAIARGCACQLPQNGARAV